MLILAALLLVHLPINATGKVQKNGLSAWATAPHTGCLTEFLLLVPGSWLLVPGGNGSKDARFLSSYSLFFFSCLSPCL